jgi:predicted phosphodiesterase
MDACPDIRFPARVISDLHLGHDICAIRDASELEHLLDGISTLILNGDTFEAKIPRFHAASQALLDGLMDLCERKGVTPILLNGNHDPASWPHDYLELFGGKMIVHHGHAFFRYVSPWSAKLKYCKDKLDAIWASFPAKESRENIQIRCEIARQCSQAMLATDVRQKNSGLLAKLGMALRELWPPRRPWMVAKTWLTLPNVATGFLDQYFPNAQIFCFGHTHRAAWWKRRNRLLVNCGGYVSFASPLCVDIAADATVSVRRIRFDKASRRYNAGKQLVSRICQ